MARPSRFQSGSQALIPGWGIKISQLHGQAKKKKKRERERDVRVRQRRLMFEGDHYCQRDRSGQCKGPLRPEIV